MQFKVQQNQQTIHFTFFTTTTFKVNSINYCYVFELFFSLLFFGLFCCCIIRKKKHQDDKKPSNTSEWLCASSGSPIHVSYLSFTIDRLLALLPQSWTQFLQAPSGRELHQQFLSAVPGVSIWNLPPSLFDFPPFVLQMGNSKEVCI